MAIQPKAKAGFYIGVTCPGCGGELELQTDFFSLECTYCGSVLRITMPETTPVYVIPNKKQRREIRFKIDRYLKDQGLPLSRSDFSHRKLYYPYWRISGIRLSVGQEMIGSSGPDPNILTAQLDYGGMFWEGRAVGASLTGHTVQETKTKVKLSQYSATQSAGEYISGIPASIGMRMQYIKAYPYSAEVYDDEFAYIPASVPWDEVYTRTVHSVKMKAGLNAGSRGKARAELFEADGSIIYFPYHVVETDTGSGDVQRFVVDGITGRVLHFETVQTISEFDQSGLAAVGEYGQLTVDFHRCTNCGVDLPATQSSVYICHNCQTVTSMEQNQIIADGIAAAQSTGRRSDIHYPFWSFKVSPEEIRLAASLAVGYAVPDRLLIPAFKIRNFEAMRRLCQRATGAWPDITFDPILDQRDNSLFEPAVVGVRQARTLAEIVLYYQMLSKQPNLEARSIHVMPESIGLVYIPFHAENYFFIDSVNGAITFEKSLAE